MLQTDAYRRYYYQSIWATVARYALVVVLGVAAMVFMVVQYQNYLGALVLFVSAMTILVIVSLPQKTVPLEIDEQKITLGGDEYPLIDLHSWVMVDMGDVVEFVIEIGGISGSYLYFYVSKTEQLSKVSLLMSQLIPYNQSLAGSDTMHRILKMLRLG